MNITKFHIEETGLLTDTGERILALWHIHDGKPSYFYEYQTEDGGHIDEDAVKAIKEKSNANA